MGMFAQGRRRAPRRFDYEPRFYNPEKEEKLRTRMRVGRRVSRRRSPAALIYFVILLAFVVYLINSF